MLIVFLPDHDPRDPPGCRNVSEHPLGQTLRAVSGGVQPVRGRGLQLSPESPGSRRRRRTAAGQPPENGGRAPEHPSAKLSPDFFAARLAREPVYQPVPGRPSRGDSLRVAGVPGPGATAHGPPDDGGNRSEAVRQSRAVRRHVAALVKESAGAAAESGLVQFHRLVRRIKSRTIPKELVLERQVIGSSY